MAYELIYSKTAFVDVQKLDAVVKKRIKNKLEEYSKNPSLYSKKLINSLIGSYRFRVGNYRIVFDLDGQKIIILRVGHRKEIYK